MADPISIALKGVATAFEICKGIYSIIDGMKRAPADVSRVVVDIQGFYSILGALEETINATREYLLEGPALQQLANITTHVGHSITAFKEIQKVIQEFIAANGKVITGFLENFRWHQFGGEKVRVLLDHLATLKLNLILALTSLSFIMEVENGQRAADSAAKLNRQMRADLGSLRRRLAEGASGSIRDNETTASANQPCTNARPSASPSIAQACPHHTDVLLDEVVHQPQQTTGLNPGPCWTQATLVPPVPRQAFVTGRLETGDAEEFPLAVFAATPSDAPWMLQRTLADFSALHNELMMFSDTLDLRLMPPASNQYKHTTYVRALFHTAEKMDRYLQRLLRMETAMLHSPPVQQFFTPRAHDYKMNFELHGEILPPEAGCDFRSHIGSTQHFTCKTYKDIRELVKTVKWFGIVDPSTLGQPSNISAVAWRLAKKQEKTQLQTSAKGPVPDAMEADNRNDQAKKAPATTTLLGFSEKTPRRASAWCNILNTLPIDLKITKRIEDCQAARYTVVVWSSTGLTWQVQRTAQDFCRLQSALNDAVLADLGISEYHDPGSSVVTRNSDATKDLQCFLDFMLRCAPVDEDPVTATKHIRTFFAPQDCDSEMAHSAARDECVVDCEGPVML